MYSVVASLAQSIGDLAEFVHRVDAPVDADGAYPVPALLKQDVQAVQEQVVKGRPFCLSDLVRLVFVRRRTSLLIVHGLLCSLPISTQRRTSMELGSTIGYSSYVLVC